ncbi:Schwann cell myelin protein-like isoform X2 [Gadus chalcogrammus]|uniref:Schwann cell myelin protein-like isoform X2 n=1 Tax=Gadus chalcogrammus TaxID=1042646 RepID=UPI0024C345B3|nr:Schwann cell myelin protein-like isoform X2 [Gadus chalcogrammus]
MTGSWKLFLLCCLLQGDGCSSAAFEAIVPDSVTTLNGSCVTVPCSFTVEDKYEANLHPGCTPTWKKDQITLSTTTFRGNLTAYNLMIQIKGDPDAPRLTTPKEPVVEGTPVELGCSAPSYCDTHPPTVTWTPALGLSTQLQQDDTVTSTLTFNASHLHHGNNVSCTAAYYIPSGNKTETSTRYQLSILYAPRNTSAVGSPCLPAGEGGCLNLTCTSHANPAVSAVTWYRIHGEHILKIGSGSYLSVQLWNANYVFFCEARNEIGTEKSDVFKIDIQDAPRNPSAVGSPCLPARKGGCLNLTCTSHANPDVSEVTWYRIHGEHIHKIGNGSSLSIQLWNANNVFFCEVRNHFGTEKSNVYKIDIQTPPRILPSSGCSRIAAWVRCSCDSVGRPSPSLEWWLDGKLVLGSEDVSVSQVNLENATLRSSLTMRAPGLTALTCHSSNAAGNTNQELPVPHLESQSNLTDSDKLPWIAAIAVLAAGLLFATACAVRAWKMDNRTRLGKDALLNKSPPNQGKPQVFFKSEDDIYANIDKLKNTVGPREEPVGAGEEAVGLGEEAAGLGEGAAGLGEGAAGLGVGAVGLGEGAVGPREEAVTAAGSSALTQRDSEEAADPAADRAWKMDNQTGLGSDALINKAPPNVEYSQLFFKSGADTYATIDKLKNTVGPREKPVGLGEGAVGLGEGAAGPREEAVTAAGSSALTQRDSEEAADPAADRQVEDCDVLYTTVNWKKKS